MLVMDFSLVGIVDGSWKKEFRGVQENGQIIFLKITSPPQLTFNFFHSRDLSLDGTLEIN